MWTSIGEAVGRFRSRVAAWKPWRAWRRKKKMGKEGSRKPQPSELQSIDWGETIETGELWLTDYAPHSRRSGKSSPHSKTAKAPVGAGASVETWRNDEPIIASPWCSDSYCCPERLGGCGGFR